MNNQFILTRTNRFMTKVYSRLLLSIIVTGVIGYFLPQFFNAQAFFSTHSIYLLYVPTLIQVVITYVLFRNHVLQANPELAWLVYIGIILLNSLTIGTIIQFYNPTTIFLALGSAATLFVIMAVEGTVIKKDLARFDQQIAAAVIALIVVSAINILLQSNFIAYVLSWLGVIIFSIASMRDAQRIKQLSLTNNAEINVIYGALSLYLDIINLFLDLLTIFSRAAN